MASIAGYSCTFGLPESEEREQIVSLGQAMDGSWKKRRLSNSRRLFSVPLHGLSTAGKTDLLNRLESSVNQMVRLSPDSHVDLGAGAGNAVDAQLIDGLLDMQKSNHEKWNGSLTFAFGFAHFTPNEDIMYIKTKVKVEGTQLSPETFTTNSGKLEHNYGDVAYPSINLATHIVSVLVNGSPYQDCKCNLVGDVSQSGSDISFQLAVSDSGNPSQDGYFYFDITIQLQERTDI